MTPVCVAATISWALIFTPVGDVPGGTSCFSEQATCEMAAMAARAAFAIDQSRHDAFCIKQEASSGPYPMLPAIITTEKPHS